MTGKKRRDYKGELNKAEGRIQELERQLASKEPRVELYPTLDGIEILQTSRLTR